MKGPIGPGRPRGPSARARRMPARRAALLAALCSFYAASVPGSASASATPESAVPGGTLAEPGAPKGADAWVRVGVIVASRRGLPDDKPLRFAYQDGEKLERLLATVGQIEPENLFFLKAEQREPLRGSAARAGARIAALKKAGRKVFLQFYYTGHGAARNFHLSDGPLEFKEVKEALGGNRADARVYVLDVCYGASFFTAKGFRTAPPLQLQMDMDKSAKGEVTISSSAVDEQAYEVRTLGGSIFTSHWIMALRGAGDRNRDGQVTLFEAYNYAYDRTSGYSAETLARPQHPSFQIDLTGARDMMLARLLRSSTGILFRNCPAGNYNVLDLGRGHQIGELRVPDGEEFTLALEPGRYRVQYLGARGRAMAADVDLPSAGMTPLPFAAFGPVIADAGAVKGPERADGTPDGDLPPSGPAASAGPGEAGAGRRQPGPFPGDARWRLLGAYGLGWFRDEVLAGNFKEPSGVDGFFGLGGDLEPPSGRRTWSFDLGYSPRGPWVLGLRAGFSRSAYAYRAAGSEPLHSVPDSARGAYPVRLRWDCEYSDLSLQVFGGRSFRLAPSRTWSADFSGGWVKREGEGERILERPLYASTTRHARDMAGTGYRLEAGLGYWIFPQGAAGPSRSNLGLGFRLSPYYQAVTESSPPPGVPALDSREAGISLSAILSLGRARPAPWSPP